MRPAVGKGEASHRREAAAWATVTTCGRFWTRTPVHALMAFITQFACLSQALRAHVVPESRHLEPARCFLRLPQRLRSAQDFRKPFGQELAKSLHYQNGLVVLAHAKQHGISSFGRLS